MDSFEFLFIAALVLYSFVIWLHYVIHKLYPWMVWLFGAGLIADIAGTAIVCIMAAARWTFTIHTVSGMMSLLIMALHFSWAFLAIRIHGKSEAYFDRFSVYAWCLWLIAFISGIPLY